MQSIVSLLTPSLFFIVVIACTLFLVGAMMWLSQEGWGRRYYHKSLERLEQWIIRKLLEESVFRFTLAQVTYFVSRDGYMSLFIDLAAIYLVMFGWWGLGSGNELWSAIAPELISTAIGIALLDRILSFRSDLREKKRVISHMSATDSNDVALSGLAVARAEGWLFDGSLTDANLACANLHGADFGIVPVQWDVILPEPLYYTMYKIWRHALIRVKDPALRAIAYHYFVQRNADLSRVNLSKANLSGTNLSVANLSGANLSGANLCEANLNSANLNGANLCGTNLSGAKLGRVDQAYVDSRSINPGEVDLHNIKYADATLIGAKYDDATVWPDGFDYRAVGALWVSKY